MTFLELYFVQFGANFLWLVLLSVELFLCSLVLIFDRLMQQFVLIFWWFDAAF